MAFFFLLFCLVEFRRKMVADNKVCMREERQGPKAVSGMQWLAQIAASMKLNVALAAPVSRKEAKRRKAARHKRTSIL